MVVLAIYMHHEWLSFFEVISSSFCNGKCIICSHADKHILDPSRGEWEGFGKATGL